MALHVLVPYDDADPAQAALEHAVTQFPDADISVLVVSDRDDLKSTTAEGDELSTDDAAAALVSERVEAIGDASGGGAGRIRTAVRPGAGADEVVDHVREAAVNHVVVGNASQSVLSRVLHGSVAERIARHSPVPVTMVDADAGTEPEDEVEEPMAARQD